MGETTDDLAWLQQIEEATKVALHQFHLQAKLLRSVLTPNAALLKFQGSTNLTVDQVLRRRVEFLTTHGLSLIGVQPEPGIVSLSIARPRREVISLRLLWQRWAPEGRDGNQSVLIGVREDDGELLVLSPGAGHSPHTLIAGSTGSGKSVLMQNIMLSIVATNRPDQARITLVDPKQGVDYFAFEGLPHLDGGIIDQQAEALARIQRLVDEMDARYVRMRHARAANLQQYNMRVAPIARLPMLWLIHDEFADWMLTEEYKQEVASAVQRLGIRARAAGIYLVFAAQRPEANVMPMQLRANLGNRLILRVDSEGTSDIALGEKGAERLLGRGHLLAKLEGTPSLVYAQVPFATPDEIDELVQLTCRPAVARADGAMGTRIGVESRVRHHTLRRAYGGKRITRSMEEMGR
jgi:S-DNA-T family DNA segregation ATPase FtsK/SpoIIIE